jgi:hypothetical protein
MLEQAEVKQLVSNDHFSVDGLSRPCASMKSFRRKNGQETSRRIQAAARRRLRHVVTAAVERRSADWAVDQPAIVAD